MAFETIRSEITGKVWKIETKVGDAVAEEGVIMVMESMKMEIPVMAPVAGTVAEILVAEGDEVSEGQKLALLQV